MQCRQCNGSMKRKQIYRLSGCLVVIGSFILICGFLTIGMAIWITVAGTSATAKIESETLAEAKKEVRQKLEGIDGLPESVIREFKTTGDIKQKTIDSLDGKIKTDVETILASYRASIIGIGLGTGMFALFGGGIVIILFIVGIPALIIGFLLVLKKKVWRCTNCGYIFARA